MSSLGFNEIILRLERYCAYQERCKHEVLQKIKTIGLEDPDKIEEAFRHLESLSFVSDIRFVESYIAGKVSIKRWGVNKIKAGLFEKRIDSNLIERGLVKIDKPLYKKNLQSLFDKKKQGLPGYEDDYVIKSKIMRFLAAKGYTAEEINSCF
jgi:regulatory protein